MAATGLLERVREAAHRHHIGHSSRSELQEQGEHSPDAERQRREEHPRPPSNEQDDDYEHVSSRQHSHDLTHISSTDTGNSSIPSCIESYEQISHTLSHEEIASQKHLGTSSSTLSISDFELLRTLGTGTFARVWLSRLKKDKAPSSADSSHGRIYALKVLRKADIIRLKQVSHVQNERAALAASAGHPFITTLVTTFKDKECLYMLLEYCPGGEVFTFLRRARRFDEDTARFYGAEIVLVLEFLHEVQGFAYRDLKPENILLDDTGHIKVVDFGFAKKMGGDTGVKETYTLCGTPEYLAPEVIRNTGHGMGTDWWALGILIYEFLYGQPPFWDHNPMKIYHQIVESNLSFPENVKTSDSARDLISSLCEPSPSRRLGVVAGGARKVKDHAWFQGTDWDALYHKKIKGPIVPHVKSPDDAENFDEYPDEDVSKRREYSWSMRMKWDKQFEDF